MKIIIAAMLLLFAKTALAQKDLLSIDEHNKYIYYQVVEMPELSTEALHTRAAAFMKSAKIKQNIATNPDALMGSGKFLTYYGVFGIKHENGEIAYQLNIECKEHKYRYWLTGFTFTPYERDRYGNFVPKPGIVVPFETAQAKLDKKELESYLNQTGAFCKELGERLKMQMTTISTPKTDDLPKKIVVGKW